jgi:protein subunit release factor B
MSVLLLLLLRLLFLLSLLQTKRKQTEKKCEMIHHIRVSGLLPATRTEESSREQRREQRQQQTGVVLRPLPPRPGQRRWQTRTKRSGKETGNRGEGRRIP